MKIKLSSSTGCYNLISIDVENQDFVEYMKNTKSTVANPIPIAGNIITKTKDELGDVPIFEEGQTITVELLPKNPDHNPVALFFCELRGNYDFNINYDLTSTSHDISSSIWLNYFTEADGNNTELLPAPNGSLFIYPKIGADNKNTTTCNIKVKDFTNDGGHIGFTYRIIFSVGISSEPEQKHFFVFDPLLKISSTRDLRST